MKIALMFAAGTNGAFGHKGALPWNIPEDLSRFKKFTEDNVVIMGSNTWRSLPKRPLKNRFNIVVTQDVSLATQSHKDTFFVASMTEAINKAKTLDVEIAWIIGGSKLIEENQSIANFAIVTKVEHKKSFDVKAPKLHESLWRLAHRIEADEDQARDAKVNYWFEYYARTKASN